MAAWLPSLLGYFRATKTVTDTTPQQPQQQSPLPTPSTPTFLCQDPPSPSCFVILSHSTRYAPVLWSTLTLSLLSPEPRLVNPFTAKTSLLKITGIFNVPAKTPPQHQSSDSSYPDIPARISFCLPNRCKRCTLHDYRIGETQAVRRMATATASVRPCQLHRYPGGSPSLAGARLPDPKVM